jgi:hypothetical protein
MAAAALSLISFMHFLKSRSTKNTFGQQRVNETHKKEQNVFDRPPQTMDHLGEGSGSTYIIITSRG